ncbi:hypothetical protein V8C37DRAFT_77139 [Trichoderma ceciliae]
MPCIWCAFRLQDGDCSCLCRRDVETKTECCIECAYDGKRCTWGGFKPYSLGASLTASRADAVKAVLEQGATSVAASMAIVNMRYSATQYLASFWENADICDLFAVQCRHSLPMSKKKKKRKPQRKESGTGNVADKDAEVQPSTLDSTGFAIRAAHVYLLREMMKKNQEMAETIAKSNEVLTKLLDNQMVPTVEDKNPSRKIFL